MANPLSQQRREPTQAESCERATISELNKSMEAHVQGEGSNSAGSLKSDSFGEESHIPVAALETNATPYISFGEGADYTYRRAAAALYKHTHALNGQILVGRLCNLPTESEYVPRKVRDPTPRGSIDQSLLSSIETSPSDYRRNPPEEVRLERERALQRIRSKAYKSHIRSPSPTNETISTNHNSIETRLAKEKQSAAIITINRESDSDINGALESESSTADSSSPQHPVGQPVDATPFVSFGEGADSEFKQVAIATHKYVYGLNSNALLGRLHALPRENEYVPRDLCHSPLTPSHDSNATPEQLPLNYIPITEEDKIENERMRKAAERPFPAHFGYARPCVSSLSDTNPKAPLISHEFPKGKNSAQLHATRKSPRVSFTSPPSPTKGSLHKTRSSRIENNTRRNQNIATGGNLSHQAVLIEDSSPNRQSKRSKRGAAVADEPSKPAVEAYLKSNKAQKQLPKASRGPVRAQRPPKVCQEPLRTSRRLAGKQPEFDMLPYEGTALQKREAPRRINANNVDLRAPSSSNRSPRNKKRAPSKAAKPQGIVKQETTSTSKAGKRKKRSGS